MEALKTKAEGENEEAKKAPVNGETETVEKNVANHRTSTASSEKDLDTFLLGDLEDSDDAPGEIFSSLLLTFGCVLVIFLLFLQNRFSAI